MINKILKWFNYKIVPINKTSVQKEVQVTDNSLDEDVYICEEVFNKWYKKFNSVSVHRLVFKDTEHFVNTYDSLRIISGDSLKTSSHLNNMNLGKTVFGSDGSVSLNVGILHSDYNKILQLIRNYKIDATKLTEWCNE
jgi:hypothetical protein